MNTTTQAKKPRTTKTAAQTKKTQSAKPSSGSKAKTKAQPKKAADAPTGRQLSEGLYHLLANVAQRSGTKTLSLLDQYGVTPAQLRALSSLAEEEAPIAVSQLAERLSLSLSTVSRLVENLAHRDLLERHVCPSDRRGRDLVLSQKGRDLVRQVSESKISDLRELVTTLSKEQRVRLGQVLEALNHLR